MEKYLEKRHLIRNVLKVLLIIATVATVVLCLLYLLVPTASTSKDTTKLVSFIPVFCIPISLSNAYKQFKIMKEEKLLLFDILQSVLSLIAILICHITILYVNIVGTANVDYDSMFNKAAVANLSIILTQWILFQF